MPIVTATIPLSGSVSGDVDLRQQRRGIVAISIPTITSGDTYIQGGFDTTSGSFTRLMVAGGANPGSGDFLRLATGPGSRMIAWPENIPVPEYIRLETAVPQAAARSFSVLFR